MRSITFKDAIHICVPLFRDRNYSDMTELQKKTDQVRVGLVQEFASSVPLSVKTAKKSFVVWERIQIFI